MGEGLDDFDIFPFPAGILLLLSWGWGGFLLGGYVVKRKKPFGTLWIFPNYLDLWKFFESRAAKLRMRGKGFLVWNL